MKQVVFVSGKGGTGKTSVTAALSSLLPAPVVIADLDVDAANLSLVFDKVNPSKTMPFMGQPRAQIDASMCTGCGKCLSACAFGALHLENVESECTFQEPYLENNIAVINPLSCEGCHACSVVCPENAISFVPHQSGEIRVQPLKRGTLVHAELGPAEDNSGKLVAEVRKLAKEEAEQLKAEVVFLDGPPGIGCPVHAAVNNVQLVVIVTEPSASGISDFERILQLCEHFNLPVAVIVNKSNLAPALTSRILNRCAERKIPVLGIIEFSKKVPKALSQRKSLLEVTELRLVLEQIFSRLMNMMN